MPGRKEVPISETEYLLDAMRHIESVVRKVRKPVGKIVKDTGGFRSIRGRIFGRGCEVEADLLAHPFGRGCLRAGELPGMEARGSRVGPRRLSSASRGKAKR